MLFHTETWKVFVSRVRQADSKLDLDEKKKPSKTAEAILKNGVGPGEAATYRYYKILSGFYKLLTWHKEGRETPAEQKTTGLRPLEHMAV